MADGKIQLKNVRLGYPALFKAKAFGKGAAASDPAFQASFYLDKKDKLHKDLIDQLLDAIDDAKEAKWGNKIPKIGSDKIALKDGDKLEDPAPEEEGHYILSARNKKRPMVLDRDKTELDKSDGRPYAGCYVDAIVRIWAQDNEYGKRINCSLEAVRFRADGEAFGAAPTSADEFEDLEDDNRGSNRKRRAPEPDDEEDRPSRNSRSRRDESEDDDRPARRRNRDEDEDRPSRRGRDEDEDRPARRSRDEDEDRPSRRSRDEEDEERPARRRGRDEDEDERPSRRSRDEDDDRPARRRNRDHDDV